MVWGRFKVTRNNVCNARAGNRFCIPRDPENHVNDIVLVLCRFKVTRNIACNVRVGGRFCIPGDPQNHVKDIALA